MRTAIFIACIVLTGNAAAQTDMPEAGEAPEFAVELIVFRHMDQAGNTPEVPLAELRESPGAHLPDRAVRPGTEIPPSGTRAVTGGATPELPATEFSAAEPPPTDDKPLLFRPLPEDKASLDRIWRRLETLDAYQPLAMHAWIQPAPSRTAAMPYELATFTNTDARIVGQATVYKERFLHLALDVGLENGPEPARLVESRRVRDDETHYFDHPRFGAVARVRRLEAENEGNN